MGGIAGGTAFRAQPAAGIAERTIGHPCAADDGVAEVRSVGDDSPGQISIDQARAAQIGLGQVGVAQVRSTQVGLGDVAPLAVGGGGGVITLQVALASIRSLFQHACARAPAVGVLGLCPLLAFGFVLASAPMTGVFGADVALLALPG